MALPELKYLRSYPWRLLLVSRDVMASNIDHKISYDMLRRAWANFAFRYDPENRGWAKTAGIDTALSSEEGPTLAIIDHKNKLVETSVGSSVQFQLQDLDYDGSVPEIKFAGGNPAMALPIDGTSLVPNLKVPIRLYPQSPDTDGGVQNDLHWKTFFMGGE